MSCKTKKQHTLAHSSTKAEYRSIVVSMCEFKSGLIFSGCSPWQICNYFVIVSLLFVLLKLMFSIIVPNILMSIVISFMMSWSIVKFPLLLMFSNKLADIYQRHLVVHNFSFCYAS